jgi:16S rRNA (guanine(1405)-N(7))-methyltransferase
MDDIIARITQDIKKSKKYKSVYDKTIERVVTGFAHGKNSKGIEKKSKNLLHQIWGAFYSTRPNFNAVVKTIVKNIAEGKNAKETLVPVLGLQSSLKERIPILNSFYKKIFEATGVPHSLIDLACGLNPLTYFWMDLPVDTTYQSFDIDEDQIIFLNAVFKMFAVKNVHANVGDCLIDAIGYADIIFMLKLLPCLEHQKKGSGIELIKKLDCKYVVVSFPVKSLSGKKAGMAEFYRNDFKKILEKEKFEFKEVLFYSELVFIVHK